MEGAQGPKAPARCKCSHKKWHKRKGANRVKNKPKMARSSPHRLRGVPHTHAFCTNCHRSGSRRRGGNCITVKTATHATFLLTLHSRLVPTVPLETRTRASTSLAIATCGKMRVGEWAWEGRQEGATMGGLSCVGVGKLRGRGVVRGGGKGRLVGPASLRGR